MLKILVMLVTLVILLLLAKLVMLVMLLRLGILMTLVIFLIFLMTRRLRRRRRRRRRQSPDDPATRARIDLRTQIRGSVEPRSTARVIAGSKIQIRRAASRHYADRSVDLTSTTAAVSATSTSTGDRYHPRAV